jgi:Purple acid Phosphatase, N-terminal domain
VPKPRLAALLACLLAVFAAVTAAAAELLGLPEVVPVSPTSVTVRWRTDVATGSRVGYGLAADAADQRAEGALTDTHEVTLMGLQPGTKYFFHVGTARKKLGTGSFVTSGSPTSAKAPANSSPLAKTSSSTASPSHAPPTAATTPKPSGGLLGIFKPGAEAVPPRAPPTRETWGNVGSLPDHFARHGGDFGAKNADDYARLAWEFRLRAKTDRLPTKVDETGVTRIYDPKTGAFAAYNRDGTTKTFFKPGSPGYFDRQPGRLIAP